MSCGEEYLHKDVKYESHVSVDIHARAAAHLSMEEHEIAGKDVVIIPRLGMSKDLVPMEKKTRADYKDSMSCAIQYGFVSHI